jgi:serine/threonine protein kinase
VDEFPTRFGQYLLLRSLNEGGMGEVFLAMSGPPGLETLCVVKRILHERRSDPDFVRRFRHESDIARRLVHGNIVQTHAVGEIDGEPFIAQEFVDGHDMQELLDRATEERRPIPVTAAVQVARGVAAALAFAHDFEGLDLVHRDVTPGNIRITYAGEVKLLDFGIAQSELAGNLTEPGQRWGKLVFMAPEQAQNRPIDRRTDIYTLGAVLWVMLSGHPMGTSLDGDRAVPPPEDKQRLFEAILRNHPPPPSRLNSAVPLALDEVVARAMAKSDQRRFANAADFAAALAPFASVVPAGAAILADLLRDSFDAKAERGQRDGLVTAARRLPQKDQAPANPPKATGSSTGRRRRRKAAAQAAQRRRRVLPVALAGAGLVVGLVVFDFLSLRNQTERPPARQTATAPAPGVVGPPTSEAAPPGVAKPANPPSRPPAPAANPAPSPDPPASPSPAKASPTESDALLERAQAAFDQGNLDRASSEARRAAALGSNEADALLGAIAFKRGRLAEAERLLKKALAHDPKNPRIARQLHLVRAKQGTGP